MGKEKLNRALRAEQHAGMRLDSLEESNQAFLGDVEKKNKALYKKEVKLEEMRQQMEQADRRQKAKEMQVLQQKMHLNAVSAHKSETEVNHLRKVLKMKQKEIGNSRKSFDKIRRRLDTSYDTYTREALKKHTTRMSYTDSIGMGQTSDTLGGRGLDDSIERYDQHLGNGYAERRRPEYQSSRTEEFQAPRRRGFRESRNDRRPNYEQRSYDESRRSFEEPRRGGYENREYGREIRQTETRLMNLKRMQRQKQDSERRNTVILETKRKNLARKRQALKAEEDELTRIIELKHYNGF